MLCYNSSIGKAEPTLVPLVKPCFSETKEEPEEEKWFKQHI